MANVKIETSSADEEILGILEKNTDGISNDELMKQTPNMENRARGEAVNSLLASGKIEMLPGTSIGTFSLRLRKGTQIPGLSAEEQLVYSVIEETGKMGINLRDVRTRTGLTQLQIKKALNAVENRKLVKSVKAVGSSARTTKKYMLYDIEADESLTGGTFYSDQQLDSQFVETLVHVCVAMLQNRRKMAEENHKNDPLAAKEFSFVRSSEVAAFVAEKGVCRVQLTLKDIERILEVAVLDNSAERRADGLYRAVSYSLPTHSAIALVPCIHCPVAKDCKSGHVISPQTCSYFDDWLKQM